MFIYHAGNFKTNVLIKLILTRVKPLLEENSATVLQHKQNAADMPHSLWLYALVRGSEVLKCCHCLADTSRQVITAELHFFSSQISSWCDRSHFQ